MSRVELSTDAKQYESSCDGIHLLTSGVSGMPYHQVVFGASSIVGDLTYAIDAAFESIVEIEKNEDKELHMVDNVIFDRLLNDDEVELAKQIFVPSPNPTVNYNTSYGIFLGYTIGLDPNQYSVAEFPGIVEEKMREDIRRNIDYILQKIRDNNLNLHSFYFYVLPFNDGETDRFLMTDINPDLSSHVETVVKLVRKAPDAYIDITVDMDELDLTASEAKATYEEIKQYILDKYDTKVSNLYIAQVKEKYGIIERENYNKPKSENSKQPQCPAEKVEMIEEALRHFKMI